MNATLSDVAPRSKRPATYEDLKKVPDNMVAEILDGELIATPRPASPHARAVSTILTDLMGPFDRGHAVRRGIRARARLGVRGPIPANRSLCMTLGPALLLLAATERARGAMARWLVTLGRVPMLYYVAHLFLAHVMAVAYARLACGDVGWLFHGLPTRQKPAGHGLGLPAIYAVWPVSSWRSRPSAAGSQP